MKSDREYLEEALAALKLDQSLIDEETGRPIGGATVAHYTQVSRWKNCSEVVRMWGASRGK